LRNQHFDLASREDVKETLAFLVAPFPEYNKHDEQLKSELLETIYRSKTPFNLKHFSLSFFIRK